MKYNSIGEQLIAKAQELDPNYKPDKFNDMSEAINIILNNSGDGSSQANKIWHELATYSGKLTQKEYDEISALVESNLLAGVIINLGIAKFYLTFSGINNQNAICFATNSISVEDDVYIKRGISSVTCKIYSDLSVEFDWQTYPFVAVKNDSGYRAIPSITETGWQDNLAIGDGLTVEGNVLKTNNIPELPSAASTKTYVLKSINGVLTWRE